jgi:hypothetical protein
MAQFKVFETGMQVNGTTIMSVISGMGTFKNLALTYLRRAGLDSVVADDQHWYSQQAWLDVFKTVATEVGDSTLYSIGLKIPETAVFPPEIDGIEKALAAIDVAYHMNHKNQRGQILFDPVARPAHPMLEGIGHYGFERVAGQNQAIMVCANPYPCAFDRGIIAAMASRFGKLPEVMHDDAKPCRKNGADSCTYGVSWT